MKKNITAKELEKKMKKMREGKILTIFAVSYVNVAEIEIYKSLGKYIITPVSLNETEINDNFITDKIFKEIINDSIFFQTKKAADKYIEAVIKNERKEEYEKQLAFIFA